MGMRHCQRSASRRPVGNAGRRKHTAATAHRWRRCRRRLPGSRQGGRPLCTPPASALPAQQTQQRSIRTSARVPTSPHPLLAKPSAVGPDAPGSRGGCCQGSIVNRIQSQSEPSPGCSYRGGSHAPGGSNAQKTKQRSSKWEKGAQEGTRKSVPDLLQEAGAGGEVPQSPGQVVAGSAQVLPHRMERHPPQPAAEAMYTRSALGGVCRQRPLEQTWSLKSETVGQVH